MKTCYSCKGANVDSRVSCNHCSYPLPPLASSGSHPILDVSDYESPAAGIKLLKQIGTEPRIRIYVETGSNKGHQSASVTLARKLLTWFDKRNPKRVLEFLCNDEDAAGKVRSIIGGSKLDGVAVEVTTFGKWFSPSAVTFSFSGAVDAPATTFGRLTTRCFIGLQPFGWAGGAEVSIAGAKQVILAKGCGLRALPATKDVPFPVPFNQLPFTETSVASPSAGSWVPTRAPDLTVKKLLDLAKGSLRLHAAHPEDYPRIYVCPIYGMGQGQPMESCGAPLWINLAEALARITDTPGLPARVILLNVSKDLGSAASVWKTVQDHFDVDPAIQVIDHLLSFDEVDDVFERLEGAGRLCICTVGGDKDQLTMDRVYRECVLPPIFEGQGSLTQVLSMGRPFIKYSSRASAVGDWKSDYLPVPGYEQLVIDLQVICNLIDDKRLARQETWDKLSGLFLQILDPDSILNSYFKECRKLVLDPRFDRLAWAAEALTRIDSKGIGAALG